MYDLIDLTNLEWKTTINGYLSHPVRVNKLTKEHRKSIFYNLKCTLPNEYLDKVWEIITYRYMFLRKRGFIVD